MTLISKLFVGFAALSLTACATVENAKTEAPAKTVSAEVKSDRVISRLSGAAYVTNNLQASVDFYTKYLNFTEGRRRTLDNDSIRTIYGLKADETVLYTSMLPTDFSRERPDVATVNFAQIPSASSSAFVNSASRKATFGEVVMAFNVTSLKLIEAKIQADGVTIIDPLQTSPTGKSQTLTVLDPNGIRVQMYEIY